LSKSGAAGLGGSKCQQEIYWIDTIEHESGLWLVPEWLATTCPQMYKPARIIQMDTLAHNLVDYHSFGGRFVKFGHRRRANLRERDWKLTYPPFGIV
jgi:hypothetical protein